MAILLTAGEPAGIGPDICLQLFNDTHNRHHLRDVIIVADADLMATRASELALETDTVVSSSFRDAVSSISEDKLNILHQPLHAAVTCGSLNRDNGRYVLDCLDTAITLCSDGSADAMVTGPVHKGIINDAGIAFSGHTEYLAAPSSSEPVMMLATDQLRVVLATTHLPLRDVPDSITYESLLQKISITHGFLKKRFGISSPRIMVCGLNPHAGEDGHLGMEEIETIQPALEHLRSRGMDLVGPLPADTAFTPARLDAADAFFAMYHDQGLPVLKYSGFGRAVNITMGLPFVRTSVDHGTALDIAGSGRASTESLVEALQSARLLSDL